MYGKAYVLDVETKSSAAKLIPFCKATCKAILLSYIVEIASHCILSKSEATTALAKIRNEGVDEFHIIFAIKPTRTAKQQRHNSNELALFNHRTKWTGNELPTNNLNCVNADFSSSNCITITDERVQTRVILILSSFFHSKMLKILSSKIFMIMTFLISTLIHFVL